MVHLLVVVLAGVSPVVDGGLSSAEVSDVLAFHEAALAPCRVAKPSTLSFIVDPDGGVTGAGGDACALAQVSQLAFPLRDQATWVSWPWPSPPRSLTFRHGPNPQDVRAVQRGQLAPIADCYLAHRKRPDNEGRFEVELVVGPSGAVLQARPGEPPVRLLGLGVDECAARVARRWRFATAKGATRVTLAWTVVRAADDAVRFGQNGAPSVVVTEADASDHPPPALREALLSQAPRLARCASPSDAGEVVSLEWDDADGGLEQVRVKGVLTPLAQCVETVFADFALPSTGGGARAVKWRLHPDGGVELVDFVSVFNEAAIRAVVQAHSREVSFCYEQLLLRRPRAAGKVTARWVVGADGAVLDAEVTEDAVNDAQLCRCIAERVRRWVFPPPAGDNPVTVTFPWIFKTAGN